MKLKYFIFDELKNTKCLNSIQIIIEFSIKKIMIEFITKLNMKKQNEE